MQSNTTLKLKWYTVSCSSCTSVPDKLLCARIFSLTKHIRRLSLKALWLLSLQHVQQSLQATQAQWGVREPSLFNQLEYPTQANANNLHAHTQTHTDVERTQLCNLMIIMLSYHSPSSNSSCVTTSKQMKHTVSAHRCIFNLCLKLYMEHHWYIDRSFIFF